MAYSVTRALVRSLICIVVFPIAILITLVQEFFFYIADISTFFGQGVKGLNEHLGLKLQILLDVKIPR